MQLKAGVLLKGLSTQMVLAAVIVDDIFTKLGVDCVITSANDSMHSDNSLHYRGYALDFRTKNYDGDKKTLTEDVRRALGPNYDVVLESEGGINEHLHVEYQPKGAV